MKKTDIPDNYIIVKDDSSYFAGQWKISPNGEKQSIELLKNHNGEIMEFTTYQDAAIAANADYSAQLKYQAH
jgi:hypothetical protein